MARLREAAPSVARARMMFGCRISGSRFAVPVAPSRRADWFW
jgi:hypothetical protein